MASSNGNGVAVATDKDKDPLGFMDRISPEVYFYRSTDSPSTTEASSHTSGTTPAPRLVVFFSWMEARSPHIAKYLNTYRDGSVFAPGTPIPSLLLVRAPQSKAFNDTKRRNIVLPAIKVLQSFYGTDLKDFSDGDVDLLVHSFSNGGCIMMGELYEVLLQQGTCMPPHVSIFDSCPARWHFKNAATSMLVGVERRPLPIRLAIVTLVYTLLSIYTARIHLTAWWARRTGVLWPLLSGMVFPSTTPASHDITAMDLFKAHPWTPSNVITGGNQLELRRGYMYSPGDQLIPVEDPEAHAAEARSRGFNVAHMEKFKDSPHVAHARTDAPRYWSVVRGLWENKL